MVNFNELSERKKEIDLFDTMKMDEESDSSDDSDNSSVTEEPNKNDEPKIEHREKKSNIKKEENKHKKIEEIIQENKCKRGKRGKRGYPGYIMPLGVILIWYGSENCIPRGWVVCNGQTYNGYVTPDLRGRFILGAGQGFGLTNRIPGQTGGEETVTLVLAQIPSHNHGDSGGNTTTTSTNGLHDHAATAANEDLHTHPGTTNVSGQHTHTIDDPMHAHNSNAVGGQGQPGIALFNNANTPGSIDNTSNELNNVTTSALTINNALTGITINQAGEHNHAFTTGGGSAHTHVLTVNNNGSHTHTVALTSQGEDEAHNNMSPYYVLIYIMKVY